MKIAALRHVWTTKLVFLPLLLLTVAATLTFASPSVAHGMADVTFTPIATHPQAVLQAGRGAGITDMKVYQGKLYTGYGDYGMNTGPIVVNPLDLTLNTFGGSQLSIPTEETMVIRELGGKLYIPMSDPRLPYTSNVGYATNATGTWVNNFKAPAVHIFDMTTLTGNDLWMVGASTMPDGVTDRGATAFRSTDGGVTWNIVKVDESLPNNISEYERYYWVANLNGKIYMQAEDVAPAAPVRIYDGSNWSEGTTDIVCGALDPGLVEVFAGKLVCGNDGKLRSFDGGTVKKIDSPVGYIRDLYVDGSFIYAVGDSGLIRSADGEHWNYVTSLAYGMQSVAIYNGYVYLGNDQAQLLKSDRPLSEFWDVPTVTDVSKPKVPVNESKVTVTLAGTNFTSSTLVKVDSQNVSAQLSNDESKLTFLAPSQSQTGKKDIVVENPYGKLSTLTDGIEYVPATQNPVISVLSRTMLPLNAQATKIKISGHDFSDQAVIKLGGTIVNASVINDELIELTLPSSSTEKSLSLTVTNPNGKSATIANAISYTKSDYRWTFNFDKPVRTDYIGMSSDGTHMIETGTRATYGSSDAGTTWKPTLETGNNTSHTAAISGDGKYQIVAEYLGDIYLSTDYGETWRAQAAAGQKEWGSTAISDDGQKIIVSHGTSMTYSNDGGQHWLEAYVGRATIQGYGLQQVAMSADGSMMVAIDGYYKVYKSLDGGTTWNPVSVNLQGTAWSLSVSADGSTVILGGTSGFLYISHDRGLTWQTSTPEGSTSANWVTQSADGQTIYIPGPDNKFYKSKNGGISWVQGSFTGDGELFHLITNASGSKIAVSTFDGGLFVSNDEGVTWEAKLDNSANSWYAFAPSEDGKSVLAASESTLLLSKNFGKDLTPINLNFTPSYWADVAMSADAKTMVAAPDTGPLHRSVDGGASWSLIESSPDLSWCSISMSRDGERIAAATCDESVYISLDHGETWSQQAGAGTDYWSDVAYSRNGQGLIAADYDGRLFVSDDSGKTLSKQVLPGVTDWWIGVAISDDAKTMVAATGEGPMYKSTDGGKTWSEIKELGSNRWYSVSLSGDGQKIIVGGYVPDTYEDILATSQDGGGHWYYHDDITSVGIYPSIVSQSPDGKRAFVLSNGLPLVVGDNLFSSPSQETPGQLIGVSPITKSPQAPAVIRNIAKRIEAQETQKDQVIAARKNDSAKSDDTTNLDKNESFMTGRGAVVEITPGKKYTFSLIDRNKNIQSHTINLDRINGYGGQKPTVTFTVHSDPQTLTMAVGESKEVDVTGDGVADLGFSVEQISATSASIRAWKLFSNIPEVAQAIENDKKDDVASSLWSTSLVIEAGIVTLLIGSVIALLIRRNRLKHLNV